MKRLLLALAFCLLGISAASATCTGPAVMKDNSSSTFNMALGQDPSGGCASNVNVLQNGALNATGNPFYFLFGTGATLPGFASPPAVNQNGNWTVRNVGNAGAILDFAGQNASSPANAFLMGGQFNTTPTTITSGNASPLQLDSAGNLLVNVKAGGGSGGTSSSFSATFPATGTAAGAEYLSSPPTLTTGQMVALQVTSAGSLHTTVDNTLTAITNGDGVTTGTWGTGSPVAGLNYAFNGTSYDRLEDDSNKNLKAVIPPPVGGANFANTQVSVGSTATQIVAARTGVSGTGRISATVCNTSTVAVYLGGSGVTTSTGQYLAGVAGACATFQTTAAIYGIVASGTETVGATEVY